MPFCRSVNLGVVPRKLIYGLNMAMFESRRELPDLTTGDDARGAVTGSRPTMEQAIGSPVTSSLAGEPCGPCLEMSLQDERNLSDDDLKHDPARGGRKQDGLAVNGDTGHLSNQVTTNKLVMRTTLMQVTGLSHPFFFVPTYKLHLARGCAIFSHWGRGDRDAIVTMGGARTLYTPRMKSNA